MDSARAISRLERPRQGGQDFPLARGEVVEWAMAGGDVADLADQPRGDPGLEHAFPRAAARTEATTWSTPVVLGR
jgi:hypothetical protein